MSTSSYDYDSRGRIDNRKPYSFSPLEGDGFLPAFREARKAAARALNADPNEVCRYVPARRFAVRSAESLADPTPLAGVWSRWHGYVAPASIDLELLLDELVEALAEDPGILLAVSRESLWAREVLDRLLQRFEVYGCVHREYDLNWRRRAPQPNPPVVVARLALLASWIAWSHVPLHRAYSLAWLNATLKLLDLVSSGVRHHGWQLGAMDRARVAAAIETEASLVQRWQLRASGGAL